MFTSRSPAGNRDGGPRADTALEMDAAARVVYVGLVTAYALACIFGGVAVPVAVVYGAIAALGLEYVAASWHSLWPPR